MTMKKLTESERLQMHEALLDECERAGANSHCISSTGSLQALKDAIILANECSESYEGVGLLYWMKGCMDDGTPEYRTIEKILAENERDMT